VGVAVGAVVVGPVVGTAVGAVGDADVGVLVGWAVGLLARSSAGPDRVTASQTLGT
jgi:hypothetical protein